MESSTVNVPNGPKSKCPGITLAFLRYYSSCMTMFLKSSAVFSILVSESITAFAKIIRNHPKTWKNGEDLIGVLSTLRNDEKSPFD